MTNVHLYVYNIQAYRADLFHCPDKEVGDDINEFTLGLSRYIVGHNLKIQSDFGIIQEDNSDDEFMFRLQMEVAF